LIANASANTKNRPNWIAGVGAMVASVARSKVCLPVATYSPMTPTSISSEPASVYSTNFTAALPGFSSSSPKSHSRK
jgi:hypothetical protein